MKQALVLAGGGSRGSYQMGAWQALRELGEEFQVITGTSIGSINAALMAQGEYQLANDLWDNITVDQVMTDGINLYPDIEDYFSHRQDLKAFFRRYTKHGGADISPFIQLVRDNIQEEKVRQSPMEMGLAAVRFPQLTPLEIPVKDMPQGSLTDYLIASCSLFPAFPIYDIEGQGYIDGGYYDNMPVNLALRMGAEEAVCIDLYNKPSHPELLNRPWVRYVRPSQPLGSILLFEKDVIARNRQMGYLDTLRSYGRVWGFGYSFEPRTVGAQEERARRFSLRLAMIQDALALRSAVGRLPILQTRLTETLEGLLPKGRYPSCMDDFLMGAELAAQRLGDIEPVHLYTLEEFDQLLLEKLDVEEAQARADEIGQGGAVKLLEIAAGRDRRNITRYLAVALSRDMLRGPLFRAVNLFPEELIAACYLEGLLPR